MSEENMNVKATLSKIVGIPEDELIQLGLKSFVEREIRRGEMEIADIRDRYNVISKDELYNGIKSSKIESHPAWEDYILWKNTENYIRKLQNKKLVEALELR